MTPDDDLEAAIAEPAITAYDPSRDHLEQIEALAPHTWLKLGKPACDADWGCARGRAYTPKMPYHGGSAYLYGEGVHAFVRPDGYYDDPLFAYRVAQHAWVALWPGTPTANPPDLRVGGQRPSHHRRRSKLPPSPAGTRLLPDRLRRAAEPICVYAPGRRITPNGISPHSSAAYNKG